MARNFWMMAIFLTFIFTSQRARAEIVQVPPIINGTYKFVYDTKTKNLAVVSGQTKFDGKLTNRIGQYSSWDFSIDKNGKDIREPVYFSVILNEKDHRLMSLNNEDGEGPYLEAASPDSHFVVFDYGTCPCERSFEIYDNEGIRVFEDSYLEDTPSGKSEWTSNGFIYAFPAQELDTNLNKETKACAANGLGAEKVEWYVFNDKEKKKLDRPPEIVCTQ